MKEAVFLSPTSVIELDAFPSYMRTGNQIFKQTGSLLQDIENKTIIETITKTKGNISEAARILGIGRNTLYRKVEKLKN